MRLLREAPGQGSAFFQSHLGDHFHPDRTEHWSAEAFSRLGIHSDLANPAYLGHRTIKGVAFLDIDETQSNFKHWSPRSALDRALFIIEMAQQGFVVVPVTGSPFSGGDPRFNIDDRISRGELFATPLLITDGGAQAHLLREGGYRLSEQYQKEVKGVIRQHKGNWHTLHDVFKQQAEETIAHHLGTEWSRDPGAVKEFNERNLATKKMSSPVAEIPVVMVQRFTPVAEADELGRVNFYVTLPANEQQARKIIAAIDTRFREYLEENEMAGLTCFAGFQQSFGFGEHVTQFSFDVGAISKGLALPSLRMFESIYGIPVDARAQLWFGGDGANDIFFVKNFDQHIARVAPGLLAPRGTFLVQPGWEQEELKKGVIAHGWPEHRVVQLRDGGLWCERLRAGFREVLGESSSGNFRG